MPLKSHLMVQSLDADALTNTLGAWKCRRGPLYARLADALADGLMQEGIAAAVRLPSERVLADLLGVSRGTVVAAYTMLAENGVVERRRGSGTVVRAPLRAVPEERRGLRAPTLGSMVIGHRPSVDLSIGAPPLDRVVGDLRTSAEDALRGGAPAHGYVPLGLPALRDGLAGLLAGWGVPTAAEQVLVTAGAQGALSLLLAALVRPGDSIVTEVPTYPGALELFSRAGATVIPVHRDHAGPRREEVEAAVQRARPRLVFLIPTAHNPTGGVMPEDRRRRLLSLLEGSDSLLVEDLTLAGLVFDGPTPPAMAALAPERVMAIGSLSKVLWGGLRTGFIRADAGMILRLGRLKAALDLGSGLLDQAAALAALPRLDDVLTVRRQQAREGHNAAVEALAEFLPEWAFARCRGGWSLWIRVPGASGDAVVAAALREGVALSPGTAARHDELLSRRDEIGDSKGLGAPAERDCGADHDGGGERREDTFAFAQGDARCSHHQVAAVDVQRRAGQIPGLLGGDEADQIGDFLGGQGRHDYVFQLHSPITAGKAAATLSADGVTWPGFDARSETVSATTLAALFAGPVTVEPIPSHWRPSDDVPVENVAIGAKWHDTGATALLSALYAQQPQQEPV